MQRGAFSEEDTLEKQRRDALKRRDKAKQLLLYAGPFPALAFFKIWAASGPGPRDLALVALIMLAFCVLILLLARRWDKPTYFDWTIGAYFALINLSLFAWPDAASMVLAQYSVTGIYACLFFAALIPPLLGMDPFTYHYAKKSTPEAFWDNPVFVRINLIMTYVWAGVFGLSTVLSLYPSVVTRAVIPLGIILALGLPFNLRFPDFYLKRFGLPGLKRQREMTMNPFADGAPVSEAGSPDPENAEPPVAEKGGEAAGSRVKLIHREKENAMKVLALNSSPRGEGRSKTGMMLNHLVLGMRDAGAEVEVVDLRKKTIRHCSGCFTCWTKTPGVCIHKDDMSEDLFPKFIQSDLVIYATPLYHFTVNATLKAFIERTLPILQPFFEESGEATRHPLRHAFPKAMVLSVAGFPEMSAFDQLSSYARFIFGRSGNLVAEIYRPAAESMTLPFFKEEARRVLEATREAGREIAQSMKITDETLARVTRDFIGDRELFRKMGNLFWKSCIAEGVTPKDFEEKGLTPRPDSMETFMMILPYGFNPAAAGDTRAVIQFDFSGDVQGSCHFPIEDGKMRALPGPAQNPELTIETPFDVWMDIMTGKADGQQMFMAQKYKVKGDLSLLIRMNQIFGKHGE
jgi:multimeric flavodoxin WrbA